MVWNPDNPVGKDEIENRNEDKVNQCLLPKNQSFHFEYHGCYCEKPTTKKGPPCLRSLGNESSLNYQIYTTLAYPN